MLIPVRDVILPTGTLRLRVAQERWPLDSLCDFAARRNPRRGFLVVSRVLGRHLPVRPSDMRRSARDLAALLPTDLPGPTLVVGLAETAVCLGQLVHAELRAGSGRDDVVFLHSTRQRVDAPLLGRFEEPHSHAAAHLLYEPRIPGFGAPGSIVLVDDEISTGTTLTNLAHSLIARWPGIETIAVLSLADWSEERWLVDLPRPATSGALLTGSLEWTPSPAAAQADTDAVRTDALGIMTQHRNRGRLGLRRSDIDVPDLDPGALAGPVRVIGTGEFGYAPFLLAERLESAGIDVVVQSTSRSPARIGNAIRHTHVFADNYGTDVPNYLYNAPPADGRLNLICHETPARTVDPSLVAALGASLVAWPA